MSLGKHFRRYRVILDCKGNIQRRYMRCANYYVGARASHLPADGRSRNCTALFGHFGGTNAGLSTCYFQRQQNFGQIFAASLFFSIVTTSDDADDVISSTSASINF